MSTLHDFITSGNDIEGLRELLRRGENPNSQDQSGRTPLHIAVLKSERNPQEADDILIVVRELINFGANVDLGDNMGGLPLHLATMCRNYKIIEIILQVNAEINKKDDNGWAALHYATTGCSFRRLDGIQFYEPELRVVKLLLKYHPDVDIQNQTYETPLMLAVRNSNLYIVRELLQKNASVNLQDSNGDSAMHYALDLPEVNVNIVLELSRHGCSFSTINYSGMTPQDSYFDRLLLNHQCADAEKAKHMIKLFMLDGYNFDEFQENFLDQIMKKNKKCKLSQFIDLCCNETMQMLQDKLTPNCSVYNLALRGGFCRSSENDSHVPFEIFDQVLDKLMRREYPVYCDVIASSICSPYMNIKFAEICCNAKTGTKFFDFDALYLISFYLSHFDMLNMMIACYVRR